MIEAIVIGFLVATIFTADWAYQAGMLAKGTALGITALLMFAAVVAVVGLVIDLLIIGFRMVFS